MAETDRASVVRQIVERLRGDDELRAGFEPVRFERVVAWAERQIGEALARVAAVAAPTELQRLGAQALERVRADLLGVARLLRVRREWSEVEMGKALMELLAMRNVSPALAVRVDDLVHEQDTLDDEAWVDRVLDLVEARTRREWRIEDGSLAASLPPSAEPPTTHVAAPSAKEDGGWLRRLAVIVLVLAVVWVLATQL